MNFEIGQRVNFRSLQWEVADISSDTFVELYGRSDENRGRKVRVLLGIEPIERAKVPTLTWTVGLGSDARQWKALHDAFRFTLSHSRGNLASVDWGRLILEPYQLVPLQRIENLPFPRMLLADDTGLGKTAEAGLILFRLMQRRRADRVLILCKARPEPERWQRELAEKFGIETVVINNKDDFVRLRRKVPSHLNLFGYYPRIIMSMHFAAQPHIIDDLRRDLRWDITIIDEAHHLADKDSGVKQLTELGRTVAERTEALLLLTATPHDGKSISFASLINLLDPYAVVDPDRLDSSIVRPLVVRRLKDQVEKADGSRFQSRIITPLEVDKYRSRAERQLESGLRSYTTQLKKQAQQFKQKGQQDKAFGAAFLETFFKKRLASSIQACRLSIQNRLHAIQGQVGVADTATSSLSISQYALLAEGGVLEEVSDQAPKLDAVETLVFTDGRSEQEVLQALLESASKIPEERESKVLALLDLLQRRLAAPNEKVVIFTEFLDTLEMLERVLTSKGYGGQMLVTYHGETPPAEREQKRQDFLYDPKVRIFLGTDAASEGINLHKSCNTLIHNEIPWNPNRYEQRNGRIDRYGQDKRPEIFLLVAVRSLEQRVAQVVIEKLERIGREVGSVSNVFPLAQKIKIEEFLSQLDAQQIEKVELSSPEGDGQNPEIEKVASQIEHLLEKTIQDESKKKPETTEESVPSDLIRGEEFGSAEMAEIQENLDASRTFVPEYGDVEEFLKVFMTLPDMDGGALHPTRENGIWSLDVPRRLQDDLKNAKGQRIENYPRVTFQRKIAVAEAERDTDERVEFLSPGHPLVQTALRHMRGRAFEARFLSRMAYRRTNAGSNPGFIFTYVLRFVDGRGETIEERFETVFVGLDGQVSQNSEEDLRRFTEKRISGGLFGNLSEKEEKNLLPRFQVAFEPAQITAQQEVERRRELRRQELVKVQRDISSKALVRLGRWEQASEDRLRQRFNDVAGPGPLQGTLDLFGERRRRETLFRKEQRKLLTAKTQRINEIKAMEEVRSEPEDTIGALVLIPEEML